MGDKDNRILIKVDGKEYEAEFGKSIIEFCDDEGIVIPRFCYHKDLSVSGNCRMCLVNVEGIPKPVIACATQLSEGMSIDVSSLAVSRLREAVMEFLLINHPLDCPVCDKAGECTLQDYSYDYGRDAGRFGDDKVVKSVKVFGDHVSYWGSRCIVCTRCVRFTDEVSGTGELAVVMRGDKSSIAVHSGFPLDNPLSMNVIDLCPVGALISRDFLYKARVWNMLSGDSVCNSCSVGCGIRVDSLDNRIKRVVPRDTGGENRSFICDYGRLNFAYIYSDDRIKRPLLRGKFVSWGEALSFLKVRLESYLEAGIKLALVLSAWNTNEVFRLMKRFDELFLKGEGVFYFYGKPAEEDKLFPGFRISGDRNPNVGGIRSIFGEDVVVDAGLSKLSMDISSGELRHLLVVGGIDTGYVPLGFSVDGLEELILLDYMSSLFSGVATLFLPLLSHAEVCGTYTNDRGVEQGFSSVIEPVGFGMSGEDILKELMLLLGFGGDRLFGGGVNLDNTG